MLYNNYINKISSMRGNKMKFFSKALCITALNFSNFLSASQPESPKSPKSLVATIRSLAQSDKEDSENVGNYIAKFDSKDVRDALTFAFKETDAQSIKNVLNAHGASGDQKAQEIIKNNSYGHYPRKEEFAAKFIDLLDAQTK